MQILRVQLFLMLIMTSMVQAQNEVFTVRKGTNIAHWLSQTSAYSNNRSSFFTRDDVEEISEMGFDHIRLPIDEKELWNIEGVQNEEAFELLEQCIEWCLEYDLKVIVDLHILRSHHFNAKEKPLWTDPTEQEKFFDLWRQLSVRLKKFPNQFVAYELMNEAVADDNESWNTLSSKAIALIRSMEPNRTIVLGSNRWQSVDTFDDLKVPKNDPNILLSFHFYDPFLLTHYRAGWTDLKEYTGPVHYPGTILTKKEFNNLSQQNQAIVEDWVNKKFDKKVIQEMLAAPLKKAQEYGLNLYCGEFGIIVFAPEKDRLIWYQDVIELFERNNIGYANWNYKSNSFGLIDKKKRNEPLIHIVTGASSDNKTINPNQ